MKKKEIYHCKKCGVEITVERHNKAVADKWIPLCEECDPEIREKFKQWYPKFTEFQF